MLLCALKQWYEALTHAAMCLKTVAAEYAMALALWTYTWRVQRLHLRYRAQ
jgi:hypothetical protein